MLKAARAAGVRRLVLTSSFAVVGYGHKEQAAPFDETSWTDTGGDGVTAYAKSKTLAERAAWDYVVKEGGLGLSVVNPVGVFGPVLGPDMSTSVVYIQRMMDGAMPGLPKMSIGVVDVRDVADLHLRAMTDPRARGERFLAVSGDFMSLREMALTVKSRMGAPARRVPTRELPDWLVRLAALADPSIRQILPELGKSKNATSAKAKGLLGWAPRSREEALVATAESLLRLGIVEAGIRIVERIRLDDAGLHAREHAFADQRLEPLHHDRADHLDRRRRADWPFMDVGRHAERRKNRRGILCVRAADEKRRTVQARMNRRHHRDVDVAPARGVHLLRRALLRLRRTGIAVEEKRAPFDAGQRRDSSLVRLIGGDDREDRIGARNGPGRGRRADHIGRDIVGAFSRPHR